MGQTTDHTKMKNYRYPSVWLSWEDASRKCSNNAKYRIFHQKSLQTWFMCRGGMEGDTWWEYDFHGDGDSDYLGPSEESRRDSQSWSLSPILKTGCDYSTLPQSEKTIAAMKAESGDFLPFRVTQQGPVVVQAAPVRSAIETSHSLM